jgi:nucleotide-binding universal stress UspA family protein
MSGIDRILVASDLSAESLLAVARATMLATAHRAHLGVLRVVDPDVDDVDLEGAGVELREALARTPAAVGADLAVVSGTPFVEIIRHARATDVDVVVVGYSGQDAGPRSGLGTTVERVIRKGDRPVLSVRRGPRGPYRRLVVGIDYSEHSAQALAFGSVLAPEAAVQVIHAYPLLGVRKLEGAGASHDEVAAYLRTVEVREAERLEAYVRERDVRGVSHHVIPGPAQTSLPALARERRADLLVVGSRGAAGLRHVLLGSVAEHSLRDATSDVLVVRHGAATFELP